MPERAKSPKPPRYDVFISSTSLDLPDHRKAAIDAVWRCGMYSLAMEKDSAVDADAIEYSLDLVDEAEVYVGIFAHRYGHIPKGHTTSITEMEYRRAVARGIPILIFIMGEDHELKAAHVETGSGAKKIEKLKKELESKHVRAEFDSVTDLSGKIFQSLTDLKPKLTPATPHRVRTIPAPPEPYIAHPYTMRADDFFGRTAELAKLDKWAASADTTLIVEAIGGVGKSALTWQWLQTGRAAAAIPDLAGVVWWSFYESDATVGRFALETLAYVTGQDVDVLKSLTRAEIERQLFGALCARPYLLVLDGIERILVAYHRMDAPQVTDEAVAEADQRKGEDVRRCTDPHHAEFLQRLAGCGPSKVLVSTRLFPRDLADRHDAGRPLPGVAHVHLNGLAPDDAVALIQHRGVRGRAADLKRFMGQFDNHSLLIGAVAGRIANYRPAPGDFAAWLADEGQNLRLSDIELKQKRTEILQYALDGLSPEQARLLSQIAAFRYPVEYDALSALNPYAPPRPEKVEEPEKPSDRLGFTYARYKFENAEIDEERKHWQAEVEAEEAEYERQKPQLEARYAEQQADYEAYLEAVRIYEASPELREARSRFHADLSALEARGLLQWDRIANRYDLHPVVRGYAFERLDGDDRAATFGRIRDYFDSLPPEDLDTAREVGDLRRSLEIYNALVGAGRLDDAARFYSDRLGIVLHYHVAAYPLVIELLTPFFPNGLDQLPALADATQQSFILMSMANALYHTGQSDQALELEVSKIGLALEKENISSLGVSLRNYAISLRSTDSLAATQYIRELACDLAAAADDADGVALAQLYLLGSYGDTGQWAAAGTAYQRFNAAPPLVQREYWQSVAKCYWAKMLVARGLDAREALDQAWILAAKSRNIWSQRFVFWLRGEIALQAGDGDAAASYFEQAMMLARKSGTTDVWVYQGGLARAWAAQGRYAEARQIVEEGGHSIDAAEVYLVLGETALARQHALRAYELAWADGSPYVWWWPLQRAKAVLAAVGEPEPDLPPFDPARVEPVPHEAEIRALIERLKAEKAAREAEDDPDVE